jgi:glycosyltransferase involved in cell wall biosynthesis
VDDGSADASGDICEEYAGKDPRIMVIHQSNLGLAAARNVALVRASGDYIGFVDADDWIEPDMYARLLAAVRENAGDIAICGYRLRLKRRTLEFGTATVLRCAGMQGMELLFSGAWFQNFVWNKLFRAELFTGIRFQEGKLFEEIPVTYRLFERASAILLCPFAGYNYVRRMDSTIGSKYLRHELDACEHHITRYLDIAGRYPHLAPLLARRMLETFTHTIFIGLQNTREEQQAGRLRRQAISAFIEANEPALLKNLRFLERCVLRLIRANNSLADYMVACWYACRKIFAKALAAAASVVPKSSGHA